MQRLLILTPRYTMVEGTFVDELATILTAGFTDWIRIGGLDHNQEFHNLNVGIAKALSMGNSWDRLVIIEQDHRYPKDVLSRVARLTEHDPIVGAPYWKRTEGELGVMVPGWWRDDRLVPLGKKEYEAMKAQLNPLHQVDIVGTCLLSIHADVLRRWPSDEPWFRPEYRGRKLIGFETWFCLKAKQLGYQISIDTRLEIDHYARLPLRGELTN